MCKLRDFKRTSFPENEVTSKQSSNWQTQIPTNIQTTQNYYHHFDEQILFAFTSCNSKVETAQLKIEIVVWNSSKADSYLCKVKERVVSERVDVYEQGQASKERGGSMRREETGVIQDSTSKLLETLHGDSKKAEYV